VIGSFWRPIKGYSQSLINQQPFITDINAVLAVTILPSPTRRGTFSGNGNEALIEMTFGANEM